MENQNNQHQQVLDEYLRRAEEKDTDTEMESKPDLE